MNFLSKLFSKKSIKDKAVNANSKFKKWKIKKRAGKNK